MQAFKIQEFFDKYHGIFSWSHPDIRQTFWTKEEDYWDRQTSSTGRRTMTLSTLWYKEQRVLQFYTNDPNNFERKLSIYNYHRDNGYSTGLTTSNNYRGNANTIIDALYYLCNPPKYYNNNGTLKKGFAGWLNRRLRSPAMKSSWVTEDMLRVAFDIVGNDIDNADEIVRVRFDIPIWSFYKDSITGKYHVEGSQQQVRTAEGWIKVHRLTILNLPNLGYTFNDEYDIWLKEDEFYHDGQVWNRSQVNIVTCTSCGRESVEEMTHEGVCHRCLGDSFKIHNYSTRVEGLLKFKATRVRPNTVYLGCELEYETKNRQKAQFAVGKLLHGHALMKSDGSIQNGFEIVTCPATLDIHLQVFKSFFDNLPPDLQVKSNVGMHVHISRKPLSQLTIGKITEFLNRSDNKEFIHHIAGRKDNHYCKMDKARSITFPWRYKHGGDRYNALNLNNQNTIEVRLFATPMDYKTFASRIQFVQALVDYCSPASTSIELKKQTHYESFMHWLSQRNRMFPELSTHLKGFN
jgi:hypothetical protein